MKKKVLLVISFILVLGLGIFMGTKFSKSNLYEEEDYVPEVTHKNMLSMMLEQNAGAGDYSLETRSSWPTEEEGYVFNSTLSKCEKGSKLRWDDENNVVVMVGTTSDKCYVYFDKYNAITINSSSVTVSGNSIIVSIDATAGDGAISKYYYSKDNGLSYVDSTSNTYTFTGLTTGDYTIKYYVEDTNGKPSEVISKEVSVTTIYLANYIKSLYTGTQGDNGLYYHDSSLANGAGDNSYRYAGANPNNFVCFGSNADTCPTDNLYRIIGVFGDQVKLIKWDYATSTLLGKDGSHSSYKKFNGTSKGNNSTSDIGSFYWGNTNVWSDSNLNKINLNTNFINNIGDMWANKIATTNWKVGGNTRVNIIVGNAYQTYQNEIVNFTNGLIYPAKIGLMYASDFRYSADASWWTLGGNISSFGSTSSLDINWITMGLTELTICPLYDDNYSYPVASVYYSGSLLQLQVGVTYGDAVRPAFYLNSDITIIGNHEGSKTDPYRID